MPHFPQALKTVLARSFSDKIAALAESAKMHGPEIGRLIKDESPLTAAKLEKLLSACQDPDDRALLVRAAVRDFVGEAEYQARFCAYTSPPERLHDDLGGPTFHADFPIHPRAAQVLHYIISRLQHDADVEQALILIGKFLELPTEQPQSSKPSLGQAMADMASQIGKAGTGRREKSAGG